MGRFVALLVVLAVSSPALAQTKTSSLAAGYKTLSLAWKKRALNCREDLGACRIGLDASREVNLDSLEAVAAPPKVVERVPSSFWVGTAIVGAVAVVGAFLGGFALAKKL